MIMLSPLRTDTVTDIAQASNYAIKDTVQVAEFDGVKASYTLLQVGVGE